MQILGKTFQTRQSMCKGPRVAPTLLPARLRGSTVVGRAGEGRRECAEVRPEREVGEVRWGLGQELKKAPLDNWLQGRGLRQGDW